MDKVISIIIATYNAGKTLHRCLESIICQKNEAIELLIIDGKSRDDTVEIVKSYQTAVVILISEKDEGIYDAWNKGVALAKGEWIMFLGADDYLLDGVLEKYIDFLSRLNPNDYDIISGKCKYITSEGKLISINGTPYNYKTFKRYMNLSHGSTLHNKKLFNELGAFNLKYRICADYEFLLRRPLKSTFFNEPILCMQAGGMSCSLKGLIETYKIRKEHKDISPLTNITYFVRGLLSHGYHSLFLF